MVKRLLISLLRWCLVKLDPPTWSKLFAQSQPRPANAPLPIEGVSKPDAAPTRLRVYRRRTYAQEQAEWEWRHNQKGQEADRRAKLGFF